MQDISADMVEAIYAEDVEPTALLITLDSADLDVPIRACSDPDGLVSRGEIYEFFPFGFAWGGASMDSAAKGAKLEIGNSDARIARAIRALPAGAQLSATCELIRTADPDDVEIALVGARVSDIDVDDPKVTATLASRSFDTEPACSPRAIASRVPGLF